MPLSYLGASLDTLTTVFVDQFKAMNAKNIERNTRLTNRETRVAAAEARLGGHTGSALRTIARDIP